MRIWNHSTTSTHAYAANPNTNNSYWRGYMRLNPLAGKMSSTYNSGNPKASRYLRGRNSVSCEIENNSDTKYELTMFRDGSGFLKVMRAGIILYDVAIGPEKLSATDQMLGTKEIDVLVEP